MSPYWNKNFFQFFGLFFQRLSHWVQNWVQGDFAADEIQLFVLLALSLSSALLGSFLVVRRMTMLANSLSHTILLGIVAAYLIMPGRGSGEGFDLPLLLFASLLTALLTTFLTQWLTQKVRLQEDASIGLVFTTLFALGIVFVTLFTRHVHLGTEAIMGNIDALHISDLKLIGFVALLNFVAITAFFKEFKITSFDASFARTLGISPSFYAILLMILVSATSIAAFRAVGVLLLLAFLVGPVLTARLFTHRLSLLIPIAAGIGALCSFVGVALSRHILTVYGFGLSTAGIVVVLIGLVFALALLRKTTKKTQRTKTTQES